MSALPSAVRAEWLLSDYATPAMDSVQLRELYGIRAGVDIGTVQASVSAERTVKVDAALDSISVSGGWKWGTGWINHPLTLDAGEHALPTSGSVSFEVRQNDDPGRADFSVVFESQAYTPEERAQNCKGTYKFSDADFAPVGEWQTLTVFFTDFAFPEWAPIPPSCKDRDPYQSAVLNRVTRIQFEFWRRHGGAHSFEIRNIVIHGIDKPPPPVPPLAGCEDSLPHRVFDLFDVGRRNSFGGAWSIFSDTSSTHPPDSIRGTSLASAAYTTAGTLSLTAALNQNGGATGSDFHKYAGWAGLSTDFGSGTPPDLTKLSGISFTATSSQWSDNTSLYAKVLMDGVSDEEAHRLRVPVSYLDGRKVCIRPSELQQPSWVVSKTAFDPAKILGFAWEARILGENDSTRSTAFGRIALDSVLLWGVQEPPVGISAAGAGRNAFFAARYDRGELRFSGLEGFDRLEILSLQGERLAALHLDGQSLRVDLQPGMYLLVARDGAGRKATRTLPVVR